MRHTLRSMLWDDAVGAMEQEPRYAQIGKKLKDIIELGGLKSQTQSR